VTAGGDDLGTDRRCNPLLNEQTTSFAPWQRITLFLDLTREVFGLSAEENKSKVVQKCIPSTKFFSRQKWP
jgi:hypothetical protein